MAMSLPVLPEEEASKSWLSMEVFSSGLESQAFCDDLDSSYDKKYETPKSYQKLSVDDNRTFIHDLVHPETHNSKAAVFMSLVHSYCKQKHMVLPMVEQNSDHPVERFARLFIASLLKLHDLVQLALTLVDKESSVSKEPESPVHFPPALADICKLVYDAKMSLVKAHQESSCSYDEICGPAIDRCLFLIENIRSAVANALGVLHKQQIENLCSRWKNISRKAVAWSQAETCDSDNVCANEASTREDMGSMKVKLFERQQSKELKTVAQVHKVFDKDLLMLFLYTVVHCVRIMVFVFLKLMTFSKHTLFYCNSSPHFLPLI